MEFTGPIQKLKNSGRVIFNPAELISNKEKSRFVTNT